MYLLTADCAKQNSIIDFTISSAFFVSGHRLRRLHLNECLPIWLRDFGHHIPFFLSFR